MIRYVSEKKTPKFLEVNEERKKQEKERKKGGRKERRKEGNHKVLSACQKIVF